MAGKADCVQFEEDISKLEGNTCSCPGAPFANCKCHDGDCVIAAESSNLKSSDGTTLPIIFAALVLSCIIVLPLIYLCAYFICCRKDTDFEDLRSTPPVVYQVSPNNFSRPLVAAGPNKDSIAIPAPYAGNVVVVNPPLSDDDIFGSN